MGTFEFDYRTAFNGLVDYLLEPFKCKNCLNYDDGVCANTDLPVNGEDFCSMARKDDEDDIPEEVRDDGARIEP